MNEKAILFISPEPDLAEAIVPELKRLVAARVNSVATVGEAIAFGGLDQFALILLRIRGSNDLNSVDGLLWSCSMARRPVPVVAVSDRYDEAEALTLFRMGVTDYLGLNEHREAITTVVGALISPPPAIEGGAMGRPLRSSKAPRALAVW